MDPSASKTGDETLFQKRQWLHNQVIGAMVFIVLTSSIVALRCIAVEVINRKKRNLTRSLRWETCLILASLIAFVPLCACAIVAGQAYLDLYSASGSHKNEVTMLKATYGISVIYPIACVLPKMSICCMYLDLFRVDALMRRATYEVIIFLGLNAIAWFIPSVIVCRPISSYWSAKPQNCLNYELLGTWISLPHIISDLVVLGLPMPILWRLQLKRSKKIGLLVTFLAASMGIVGACLRLAFYVYRLYYQIPDLHETTKSIAGDYILSYVEPGMYLIAACLPRLTSLVTRLHDALSMFCVSLISRRSKPDHPSQSAHQPRKRLSSGNRRLLTQFEMTWYGRSTLESRASDESAFDSTL